MAGTAQSNRPSAITRSGPIWVVAAALLWSTGGIFIKSISLDAWGVSFWRSLFAAATLLVAYRVMGSRIEKLPGTPFISRNLLLISFFYSLLLILFVIATKLTTSANAIFLQYTAPIYILFLEPLLTRTKIKRPDIVAVAISLGGMALFFAGDFDVRGFWGNVAALASGVAFAIFAILLKHKHADEATRWRAVIVGHFVIALLMGILAFAGVTSLTLGQADLLMLLYLGIVQIGIAYALFTYGVSHVRAIDATLLSMVEPVLNPVWVFLGIGERPNNYALIGGAIIIVVVAVRALYGSPEIAEAAEAH